MSSWSRTRSELPQLNYVFAGIWNRGDAIDRIVEIIKLPPICRYGFIVMDGNGSLFGTLSGNTRDVLHKFTVDLPKKHGRGGQSALRFARLRLEKRHNYVRKVSISQRCMPDPGNECNFPSKTGQN